MERLSQISIGTKDKTTSKWDSSTQVQTQPKGRDFTQRQSEGKDSTQPQPEPRARPKGKPKPQGKDTNKSPRQRPPWQNFIKARPHKGSKRMSVEDRSSLKGWVAGVLGGAVSRADMELRSGVVFCQLVDQIYPGSIAISSVRPNAKMLHDRVHNRNLLVTALVQSQMAMDEVEINTRLRGTVNDLFVFLKLLRELHVTIVQQSPNEGEEPEKKQPLPKFATETETETQTETETEVETETETETETESSCGQCDTSDSIGTSDVLDDEKISEFASFEEPSHPMIVLDDQDFCTVALPQTPQTGEVVSEDEVSLGEPPGSPHSVQTLLQHEDDLSPKPSASMLQKLFDRQDFRQALASHLNALDESSSDEDVEEVIDARRKRRNQGFFDVIWRFEHLMAAEIEASGGTRTEVDVLLEILDDLRRLRIEIKDHYPDDCRKSVMDLKREFLTGFQKFADIYQISANTTTVPKVMECEVMPVNRYPRMKFRRSIRHWFPEHHPETMVDGRSMEHLPMLAKGQSLQDLLRERTATENNQSCEKVPTRNVVPRAYPSSTTESALKGYEQNLPLEPKRSAGQEENQEIACQETVIKDKDEKEASPLVTGDNDSNTVPLSESEILAPEVTPEPQSQMKITPAESSLMEDSYPKAEQPEVKKEPQPEAITIDVSQIPGQPSVPAMEPDFALAPCHKEEQETPQIPQPPQKPRKKFNPLCNSPSASPGSPDLAKTLPETETEIGKACKKVATRTVKTVSLSNAKQSAVQGNKKKAPKKPKKYTLPVCYSPRTPVRIYKKLEPKKRFIPVCNSPRGAPTLPDSTKDLPYEPGSSTFWLPFGAAGQDEDQEICYQETKVESPPRNDSCPKAPQIKAKDEKEASPLLAEMLPLEHLPGDNDCHMVPLSESHILAPEVTLEPQSQMKITPAENSLMEDSYPKVVPMQTSVPAIEPDLHVAPRQKEVQETPHMPRPPQQPREKFVPVCTSPWALPVLPGLLKSTGDVEKEAPADMMPECGEKDEQKIPQGTEGKTMTPQEPSMLLQEDSTLNSTLENPQFFGLLMLYGPLSPSTVSEIQLPEQPKASLTNPKCDVAPLMLQSSQMMEEKMIPEGKMEIGNVVPQAPTMILPEETISKSDSKETEQEISQTEKEEQPEGKIPHQFSDCALQLLRGATFSIQMPKSI